MFKFYSNENDLLKVTCNNIYFLNAIPYLINFPSSFFGSDVWMMFIIFGIFQLATDKIVSKQ